MADDVDPTKTLNSAREKLVEERRGLAVAIALGYRRRRTDDPHTNESRAAFIDVQNLIEAIDRALADEKLIGYTRPAPSIVPALEAAPSVAPGFDRRESSRCEPAVGSLPATPA